MSGDLSGRRVLIVEDEFLIALELRMVVEDAGAEVIEAASVAGGRAALEVGTDRAPPDMAVLDVRLGEEEVFPLADDLARMGVPFVFHSGHAGADELAARYPKAGVLSKPTPPERLIAALVRRAG